MEHKKQAVNVILSGGSGTRLWPLSRHGKPKQFLEIFDKQSLFQHTVLRNQYKVDDFLLITNASQIAIAERQMLDSGVKLCSKIIESVGRNTAPAIALACFEVAPETILFVTPSDQMITDSESYQQSLSRAFELAAEGFLVTFGIQPQHPETGFGYIEADGESVICFKEKPDYKTAQHYVASGNFYWNSGMFCFKACVYLAELKKLHPQMYQTCLEAHENKNNFEIPLDFMQRIPDDSIDYAILEKSDLVKTVPSSFEWTDLGSFDAIIEFAQKNNNVNGFTAIEGTTNSFALSNKFVAAPGIDNLLVVDTEDALLILPVGKSDRVKEVYKKVQNSNSSLL